jgi:hypothetical protein
VQLPALCAYEGVLNRVAKNYIMFYTYVVYKERISSLEDVGDMEF